MINSKRFKYVKPVDPAPRRIYIRRFSDVPPELLGTKMEKEQYLNTLTRKTLHVFGVQPRHG